MIEQYKNVINRILLYIVYHLVPQHAYSHEYIGSAKAKVKRKHKIDRQFLH